MCAQTHAQRVRAMADMKDIRAAIQEVKNGELASVAAGQYVLNDSTVVEFKYMEWEGVME